jgi:hypothetical protein
MVVKALSTQYVPDEDGEPDLEEDGDDTMWACTLCGKASQPAPVRTQLIPRMCRQEARCRAERQGQQDRAGVSALRASDELLSPSRVATEPPQRCPECAQAPGGHVRVRMHALPGTGTRPVQPVHRHRAASISSTRTATASSCTTRRIRRGSAGTRGSRPGTTTRRGSCSKPSRSWHQMTCGANGLLGPRCVCGTLAARPRAIFSRRCCACAVGAVEQGQGQGQGVCGGGTHGEGAGGTPGTAAVPLRAPRLHENNLLLNRTPPGRQAAPPRRSSREH